MTREGQQSNQAQTVENSGSTEDSLAGVQFAGNDAIGSDTAIFDNANKLAVIPNLDGSISIGSTTYYPAAPGELPSDDFSDIVTTKVSGGYAATSEQTSTGASGTFFTTSSDSFASNAIIDSDGNAGYVVIYDKTLGMFVGGASVTSNIGGYQVGLSDGHSSIVFNFPSVATTDQGTFVTGSGESLSAGPPTGGADYSRLKDDPVGIAGAISAALEVAGDGVTIGNNLKPYWNQWGGNGSVQTAKVGEYFHALGTVFTVGSVLIDTDRALKGEITPKHWATNMLFDGIGLMGPWGAAASIIYYGYDQTHPHGVDDFEDALIRYAKNSHWPT